MQIIIPMIFNIAMVVLFYLLEKRTAFAKMKFIYKQLIIGAVFGVVAITGSLFGWTMPNEALLNAKMNVRDSAPLSAGLIFGWPAGLIAGFIGGAYRGFFGVGEYTALACSVSTLLAGVIAGLMRRIMFDDKKPTWGYAVGIAIVMEVLHMLLILITNINDPNTAFAFIRICTIPMAVLNAITLGVSVVIVTLLSKERIIRDKNKEQIAQTFQRWLVISILIAFVLTSLFTYNLQTDMRERQIRDTFESTITDVLKDITDKSDKTLKQTAIAVKTEYLKNPPLSLKDLAATHGVTEINVVNKDGLIINSTEDGLAGSFNMNSTDQSREFMILADCKTETTYVQAYGPVGSDGVTMRKLAGISLENGGFLQVGYNEEQFRSNLDQYVVDFTKNRHVGVNGFVAVCDEQLRLITENEYNGMHVSAIGIDPNEEMKAKANASKIYTVTITEEKTEYKEKYLYVFTFSEGYYVIATIPEDDAMLLRDASAYLSIYMQVVTFAALFVLLYFLIKKIIIENIHKINGTLSKISSGNLTVTVDVRSSVEFASLSDDINTTVDTLKRYIKEAEARIDKELEYAKQIQLAALPSNFINVEEYELYAQMIAAREVGGDFYDFYKLNDTTVAFLVADVSGKGIPAAMFMMTAKTIIKDLAERGLAVNDIFTLANQKLCENNESGMFVTAWMGILDVLTGKLTFANAGHNPPLICRGGKFEYLKTRAGFVLAGVEGVKYRINELTLEKGDRIFLYTDGVTEATDTKNDLYGEQKLIEFANGNTTKTPSEFLKQLKSDIDLFVGEAPQFDDITMLMFDYKKDNSTDNQIKRTFKAKVDELPNVLAFIEEHLEKFECSLKYVTSILIAVEEVFVNVAHYAYNGGDGDVTFMIGFDKNERVLSLTMIDQGIPFDPLKKADPDVTLGAHEREIGGLGIFITKKTMDQLFYRYVNGENVLIMTKKI